MRPSSWICSIIPERSSLHLHHGGHLPEINQIYVSFEPDCKLFLDFPSRQAWDSIKRKDREVKVAPRACAATGT